MVRQPPESIDSVGGGIWAGSIGESPCLPAFDVGAAQRLTVLGVTHKIRGLTKPVRVHLRDGSYAEIRG
jgi:hypothetical protein